MKHLARRFAGMGKWSRLGGGAALIGVFFAVMLGLLAAIPALSPGTGAEMADWLRATLGLRPVAFLEGESLAMQDTFNRLVSSWNGGRKAISLAGNLPRPQHVRWDGCRSGRSQEAVPARLLPGCRDRAAESGLAGAGAAGEGRTCHGGDAGVA